MKSLAIVFLALSSCGVMGPAYVCNGEEIVAEGYTFCFEDDVLSTEYAQEYFDYFYQLVEHFYQVDVSEGLKHIPIIYSNDTMGYDCDPAFTKVNFPKCNKQASGAFSQNGLIVIIYRLNQVTLGVKDSLGHELLHAVQYYHLDGGLNHAYPYMFTSNCPVNSVDEPCVQATIEHQIKQWYPGLEFNL